MVKLSLFTKGFVIEIIHVSFSWSPLLFKLSGSYYEYFIIDFSTLCFRKLSLGDQVNCPRFRTILGNESIYVVSGST